MSVLLVDKPAGPTSHDIVARLRHEHSGKVGHCGTLDPFASGLMIVLVGRDATRQQPLFMELSKTYWTKIRLGATSSTGDREGEITRTGRVPDRIELPTGEIRQRTPRHSAVRVRGVRGHRLARAGARFEPPPRIVTVERYEELWRGDEEAELEIACSSGTYVRSLVDALDDAYCLELRRLSIGPFHIDEASREGEEISLDEALTRLEVASHGRVRRR